MVWEAPETILLTTDGLGVAAKQEALDKIIRATEERVVLECIAHVCINCASGDKAWHDPAYRDDEPVNRYHGTAHCAAFALHAYAARLASREPQSLYEEFNDPDTGETLARKRRPK